MYLLPSKGEFNLLYQGHLLTSVCRCLILKIKGDIMFNKKSIQSLETKKLNNNFILMDDVYNFARIPYTILNNFGKENNQGLPLNVLGNNKKYKKVILFLIDAFGYVTFKKFFHNSTFLKKVVNKGIISKLTTQFPSTTSSNITTIHSGLSVGESGVIEWYYYEPVIDDIFSPLIYKKALASERLNIEGSKILPQTNLYQQLNVKSYIFQYRLYNEGPYAKYLLRGSNLISFESFVEGLELLSNVIKNDDKAYYFFYHSDYDEICHNYGPDSLEAKNCLFDTFKELDKFIEKLESENEEILILLTADHGQTTINKDNAIYLNLEYPEILPYIKRNQLGEYIAPCGSFRDMFLHIQKDAINEVYMFLKDKLKGKAEVYTIEELIKWGLFGKIITDKFYERIGDIIILPYKGEAVWWYEKDKYYVKHLGMHGGLTKEEMEIPFIVYHLGS